MTARRDARRHRGRNRPFPRPPRTLESNLHTSWRRVCRVRGEWFGHGYEHVLLRLAEEAAARQLLLDEQDYTFDDITSCAWQHLSPYGLKETAA